MKKFKAFAYTYTQSLSSVAYYKDVLKATTNFSIKYFLVLAAFATIITTTRVALPLIPEVRDTVRGLFNEISQIYPEELVITAMDGEWNINQKEPFTLAMPYSLEIEGAGFPSNILVFYHEGTINDLDELDTLILVNNVNIVTRNNQSKIEAYPLTDIPDGEFTKVKFDDAINRIDKFIDYLPLLMYIFILIGTFFYYFVIRFLCLFLVAFILLAFGTVLGMKEHFNKYFRLALHTFTLPLTFEVSFVLLGLKLDLPFWFLGLNLIFGIVVIYSFDKSGKKKKPATAKGKK